MKDKLCRLSIFLLSSVGRASEDNTTWGDFLLPIYSSIAQLVEHAAVNRRVVGSSPTGGAIQPEL